MTVQELINRFETGTGAKLFKAGLIGLAVVLLIVGYAWRGFKNFGSQEAMDSAQLARNIAKGKGYTTFFVRPFSVYLIKKKNQERLALGQKAPLGDLAQLKDMHPDIANAPVYPVLLAGFMKVASFHYSIPERGKPFWSTQGHFWRYQPDFLISLFNQGIFLLTLYLVFRLANRLFDAKVAWLTAVLMLGTELYWRFSVSGLSTSLLLLLFVLLVWCLVLLEQEGREAQPRQTRFILVAVATGLVLGLMALTRYSLLWLVFPVIFFLSLWGGPRRWLAAVLAVSVFALVVTPWIMRNMSVSGEPFGTVTYTIFEGNSAAFNEYGLQRSLEPSLAVNPLRAFWPKLVSNTRNIISNDLPRIGGSWVSAFFLAGLMVLFRTPSIARIRYFTLATLVMLVIVQALAKTQLSEDVPEINSENLLVIASPLVLIYGAAFFFVLLENVALPLLELRLAVIVAFAALACLPMLFAFIPPRNDNPLSYPPYFPPHIQSAAAYIKESELAMSDLPWAMAWYGQSQCVWTPRNSTEFFVLNDYIKPVQEIFLTRATLDSRFMSGWVLGRDKTWGSLVLQTLTVMKEANEKLKKNPELPERLWPISAPFVLPTPDGRDMRLPLSYWQPGWPEYLLFTGRPNYAN